ncbi:DegV family protein [Allokutzneria sp. A3M-2-11 16]|uniref:DegV family protein n=1 Tax=Allokutzneria sp. A3M-2-11 16 TaxID=2962043 RepID=UPI0020B78685|nr:DegV family protein [Allokutzneria sp. A3M-2-11 16]MCP3800975.1 DegV family protein [Allokutzneria sp. A3M-2-11 16]
MAVAVVTDSTAYLPEGFADRRGISVVPLHVTVDDSTGLDGVDITPASLANALSERRAVSTSRPSPEDIAAVYRRVLDSGADSIVSVHLSRELSGTWDAARIAAGEVGGVRVVDSRSTAMGLGFAVLAAVKAARSGASASDVEAAAVRTAARTRTFFCLETLEHLRRGGRIGPAAALLGTALAVRPLLHVQDGRIVPLEKVRTTSRAMARLVDLAAEAAGDGPAGLAVHHLCAPQRAAELASKLDERLTDGEGCLISEVGAVIGAHTGLGVLGVVVLPGGLS